MIARGSYTSPFGSPPQMIISPIFYYIAAESGSFDFDCGRKVSGGSTPSQADRTAIFKRYSARLAPGNRILPKRERGVLQSGL